MLENIKSCKYKTPNKVPYQIIHTCENGTVILHMGSKIDVIILHYINHCLTKYFSWNIHLSSCILYTKDFC